MNLARQGVSFLLIGAGLVVADWCVFVMLSAAGVPPTAANVVGRAAGALLGFWANGWLTFSVPLGRQRLLRYVLVWVVLTFLSTTLIMVVTDHLGLQTAWLAKPVVEGTLAVISFIVSRHWIYR